jgi:poly(A) polymerase
VVEKSPGKLHTFDFTDFRGKTIEKDLKHRDFTINALALDLKDITKKGCPRESIIDPCGGRQDLKRKIIRVINNKSFSEDPLRILRAFSFACQLDFKAEPGTIKQAGSLRQKLTRVSAERIRDELFKVFDSPYSFAYLNLLDKLKILKIIFPEIEKMRGLGQGPYHHLDIWQHSLQTLKELELSLGEFKANADIQDYLNENVSGERKRLTLMKVGALLHDVGKPDALRREGRKLIFHGHERIGLEITERISRRLKLSNGESAALKKMVFFHLRPGYLADSDAPSPRAIFRFFRDTDKEAVSVLLISLADQRSTRGPLTTRASRLQHERLVAKLIREYFRKKKERKLPRLIDGHLVMRQFKLEPSKLIGRILSEVEELQAIGKVRTRPQALAAVKSFLGSLKG